MIFLLVNNEDILKVLGKNIKKIRKEKGYTQDYVAEQINVSTDLLRSIENGRNIGSITTLLNICNFLQVSPNTLFAELLDFKEETLDSSLLNLTNQLSKEGKNILKEIISISSVMSDHATGIMLCKKIQESKLLPCNKGEIIGILETLAICGILETPEHKGYIHSFTPPLMRDTGDLRQSLSYPLNWWCGENKVNYDNCYKIFNIDFSHLSRR